MNSRTGSSTGRSRRGDLREGGREFAMACRTILRCTPNFSATPVMVPIPNSYSRLICSKSSTLFLLVIGGLHDSGLLSQRGEGSRDEVGQIRAPKWAKSECQNQRECFLAIHT